VMYRIQYVFSFTLTGEPITTDIVRTKKTANNHAHIFLFFHSNYHINLHFCRGQLTTKFSGLNFIVIVTFFRGRCFMNFQS